MRTPLKIYNVVTSYNPYPVVSITDLYPTLYRLADVQIPYSCRVMGFNLTSAGQMALGALVTFSVFAVVGQSAAKIVVSPTIRTLGSHLYLFRSTTTFKGAQTSALFFGNVGYHVDANEPVALYISEGSTNDLMLGILSLYVVPDP